MAAMFLSSVVVVATKQCRGRRELCNDIRAQQTVALKSLMWLNDDNLV